LLIDVHLKYSGYQTVYNAARIISHGAD
jgi:hypothetical protein